MGIQSLADIIRVHGRERADHPALILGDREITWGQLLERAGRAANALAASGVGPQDRVAFLDKNGFEHFEAFYGAALLNAVCVDVNWRLAAPEVEFIVNDADAKVLFVGREFVPILDAILPNLTTVKHVLVIDGDGTHDDYAGWVDSFPADDPGITSANDDVSFQLYSSGTTGRPKGVMLTNDNLFTLVPEATRMWEFDSDSVV